MMTIMAKKPAQPEPEQPPRGQKQQAPISYRPRRPEARLALERAATRERRPVSQMVDVIVEDWLIANGLLGPEQIE